MAIVITFADLRRTLERHIYSLTREAPLLGATIGARKARALLVKRSPTDLGQLRASWRVRPGRLQGNAIQMPSIENDAPHAGIVELGARPHGVNLEGRIALYEWVRRHFRFTVGKSKRMQRVTGETFEDPVLNEIMWGIVAKLKREGQKPTYFVRDSLKESGDLIFASVKRHMNRAHRKGGKR